MIAAWFRAVALGRPVVLIGPDTVRRDFVYVTDAAEAALASLAAPAAVYNVGGGESVALGDLLVRIGETTGRSLQVDRRPGRGVDLPVTHLDISRIRAATGWQPRVSVAEGLKATWDWEIRTAT